MTNEVSSARKHMEQLARDYQRVLQKARADEHERLEEYRARLAVLVEQYAQAQPAPPKPLTIPAIFGLSYRENFISDYLAYALDPAKNGIGEAPLTQLLHLCGIDVTDLPVAEVTVHREYSLETGQIDFLLEWEDALVLGIENKILSREGPEQTVRYARAFRRQFKDIPYHLVYLTPKGQKAGSIAFQSISYSQLVAALREVRVGDDVSARRRVLWEDLLEHLEVYIIMSDPEHFEFSEKARLYIEHRNMIEDLESAFDSEWNEAIAYLEQQVYAHLDGGPWTTSFGSNKRWQQIYKPNWSSPELFVHYECYLSVGDLELGKTSFMAEAERKQAGEFLALFDRRYPRLEAQYQEQGILYRPPQRGHAIAWKEFPISQDIEWLVQVFADAFGEFRFLEKEIDQVVAELALE